jgi:ABC-type sugar transport system ATPase subunit
MTLADTLWFMNEGRVEQKGPPLEVYERPRTKFVAGFLGSPPINFLDVTLGRDAGVWRADGSGVLAPLEEERYGDALAEGRLVTVGIRPHDFVPAADPDKAAATLKVELVEALGFEAFVHGWLRVSGPRVIARVDADAAKRVRAGDALPLYVDLAPVHLFDPATGLALDAR